MKRKNIALIGLAALTLMFTGCVEDTGNEASLQDLGFLVAFKTGGASGKAPETMNVNWGRTIWLPYQGDLKKSGHVFSGWNDGSRTYSGGSSYYVQGDVLFTAQWTQSAVPSAPTGVTATAASSSSITISWSAVSGATEYRVYRSTSSSGTYTQVGTSTTTSFTNTGLTASTTYYYRVRAYNSAGESGNSTTVNATTRPPTTIGGSDFTETVGSVSFNMIAVDGGTFTMGCTSEQGSDCDSDERPTSQVTLSSFHIAEFEVTQGLWRAVTGSSMPTSCGDRGIGDNHPVYCVSWNDIVNTFLPALNTATGKTYRLPTEAEWEFAARGGNQATATKYAGSNNINDVAWYTSNSSSRTQPVGTKAPNELGLYDMSGNVWEWVHDWYGSYTSSAKTDPTGPSSGSNRVNRGGSWNNDARNARVSNRNGNTPSNRDDYIGFRLVVSSP